MSRPCNFHLGDCLRCGKRAERDNQLEPCARSNGPFARAEPIQPWSDDPFALSAELRRVASGWGDGFRLPQLLRDAADQIDTTAHLSTPTSPDDVERCNCGLPKHGPGDHHPFCLFKPSTEVQSAAPALNETGVSLNVEALREGKAMAERGAGNVFHELNRDPNWRPTRADYTTLGYLLHNIAGTLGARSMKGER